jgi:hypothetical protein
VAGGDKALAQRLADVPGTKDGDSHFELQSEGITTHEAPTVTRG